MKNFYPEFFVFFLRSFVFFLDILKFFLIFFIKRLNIKQQEEDGDCVEL